TTASLITLTSLPSSSQTATALATSTLLSHTPGTPAVTNTRKADDRHPATDTATLTPLPTHTHAPTAIPSITPTPGPQTITAARIPRLVPLATWGMGNILDTAWSPDGTMLAVGTTLGLYLFDTRSDQQIRLIRTDQLAKRVAFNPRTGDL